MISRFPAFFFALLLLFLFPPALVKAVEDGATKASGKSSFPESPASKKSAQPRTSTTATKSETPTADSDRPYATVGFDQLSGYLVTTPSGQTTPQVIATLTAQIPEKIRALDGTHVVVTGYMLPTKIQDGRTTEFILLRNQMACCYGIPPEANEWIVVKMPGAGVPATMDLPVSFAGTIHVGVHCEEETFDALYVLDGEKMLQVKN